MTTEALIEKFNPALAATLTPEDLETLRNLTDPEIAALAKAYPNDPQGRSYLVLSDKDVKAEKQLYQLSTWANLNSLRRFSGKKNLVPYGFRGHLRPRSVARASALQQPKRVPVDLTPREAAEELTKALNQPTTVPITAKAANRGPGGQFLPKTPPPEGVPLDQQFDEPE